MSKITQTEITGLGEFTEICRAPTGQMRGWSLSSCLLCNQDAAIKGDMYLAPSGLTGPIDAKYVIVYQHPITSENTWYWVECDGIKVFEGYSLYFNITEGASVKLSSTVILT